MLGSGASDAYTYKDFQVVREIRQLHILICDDDTCFLETMSRAVEREFRELNIGIELSAFDRSAQITDEQLKACDIAFLDIDFVAERRNGIDIARALRKVNKKALIIFVTNFVEYAPEGYEVQAFRYILKRELESNLKPYIHQAVRSLNRAAEVLRLLGIGDMRELPFDSILYMEVLQHSVSIFAQNGDGGKLQIYRVNVPLTRFDQQLEGHGFLRVHKSYLVNMRHIRSYQCKELCLDNGMSLRVSEKNYAEQKRKYLLWKGWQ